MGWSCAREASLAMERISATCRKNSGSSNTWKEGDEAFFFESSNREHHDGAITGSVFKMVESAGDNFTCVKAGSFRIEPDGRVSRGPRFMKAAAHSKVVAERDGTVIKNIVLRPEDSWVIS